MSALHPAATGRKTGFSIEPLFVSVTDAAHYLGLSEFQVKQELRKGSLSARKAGRRTLIEMASLKTFGATLPIASFAPPSRGLTEKLGVVSHP
jgi:hypothetical protein